MRLLKLTLSATIGAILGGVTASGMFGLGGVLLGLFLRSRSDDLLHIGITAGAVLGGLLGFLLGVAFGWPAARPELRGTRPSKSPPPP